MNGEQLIDKVRIAIDDDSYSNDDILSFLNEAAIEISSRLTIPSLEELDFVDTVIGEGEVSLPENYQHGLFDCQSPDTALIDVCNSRRQLLAKYGGLGNSGSVRHVAAVVPNLIYQPMPLVVTTLTLGFYGYPPDITEADTPTWLRKEFHAALCDCATFNIFEEIEDEEEGPKTNVKRYEGRFEKKMQAMELYYRDGQSHPEPPVVQGEYM